MFLIGSECVFLTHKINTAFQCRYCLELWWACCMWRSDPLWSWGPESALSCIYACLSQLTAVPLIVVKHRSNFAGHPLQSNQEGLKKKSTQFNSLPIIQIGVFSGGLLLVAFSSLNFPSHIPPTHPKTRVTWKGSLPPHPYHWQLNEIFIYEI